MAKYIDKDALMVEIERRKNEEINYDEDSKSFASYADQIHYSTLDSLEDFIDTLEVKDPYEQCVQYDSIKAGIQAHAETYSFNIESNLFNQLTKEQQKLWRKEIEQACVNGGEVGAELARDTRYKENLEVKKPDLDKALSDLDKNIKEFVITEEFERESETCGHYWTIAKHAFLFGFNKAQEGIN